MKWIRRITLVIFAAAVVAAIVWTFLPSPIGVDLAEAVQGPFEATVDADGVTRVRDRYVIAAPLAGNLQRITLRAGDAVDPGMVIARLSPVDPPLLDARTKRTAEAQLGAARARLGQMSEALARAAKARDYATSELARTRQLADAGSAARAALDRAELEANAALRDHEAARFAVDVATYELELASATLSRFNNPRRASEIIEVRAPVHGRILRVLKDSEGPVALGTALVEVADPAALEVVVDVLTSDAVAITSGASASLEGWGGRSALTAHVRRVEPAAFTKVSALGIEEQRVNVILDIDAPHADWAALGDAYRVRARIVTWQADDALQVPTSALFRDGERWAVYQIDGDRARLAHVEIGRRAGLRSQVTGGLVPGQRVVMHPGDAVDDGVAVRER